MDHNIRSLLITLQNVVLLLPNTAVVEILPQAELTPLDNVPQWLLGVFTWRSFKLPLLSFEGLADGLIVPSPYIGPIAVVNRISAASTQPFFAILMGKYPRLKSIEEQDLTEVFMPEQPWYLRQVTLEHETVCIPNFSGVELALEPYQKLLNKQSD